LLVSTAIRVAVDLNLPNSIEYLIVKVMARKASGSNNIDEDRASGVLFQLGTNVCH